MFWLTLAAFFIGLLSASFSVYLYTELSKKLNASALKTELEKTSESFMSDYARKFKALETEWDDMYEKFGRLAGRMDRKRAIDKAESPPPPRRLCHPAPICCEITGGLNE